MYGVEIFKDMNIRQLIKTLAMLYAELEGITESEALSMARSVARRALIEEIQWVDYALDK